MDEQALREWNAMLYGMLLPHRAVEYVDGRCRWRGGPVIWREEVVHSTTALAGSSQWSGVDAFGQVFAFTSEPNGEAPYVLDIGHLTLESVQANGHYVEVSDPVGRMFDMLSELLRQSAPTGIVDTPEWQQATEDLRRAARAMSKNGSDS